LFDSDADGNLLLIPNGYLLGAVGVVELPTTGDVVVGVSVEFEVGKGEADAPISNSPIAEPEANGGFVMLPAVALNGFVGVVGALSGKFV